MFEAGVPVNGKYFWTKLGVRTFFGLDYATSVFGSIEVPTMAA